MRKRPDEGYSLEFSRVVLHELTLRCRRCGHIWKIHCSDTRFLEEVDPGRNGTRDCPLCWRGGWLGWIVFFIWRPWKWFVLPYGEITHNEKVIDECQVYMPSPSAETICRIIASGYKR